MGVATDVVVTGKNMCCILSTLHTVGARAWFCLVISMWKAIYLCYNHVY